MFETLGYQTCSPGFLRSQFIVVISCPTHSFPTIRPKLLKTELMPESTLLSQHITSWEKRKNRACSPGVSRALIAQSLVRRRPVALYDGGLVGGSNSAPAPRLKRGRKIPLFVYFGHFWGNFWALFLLDQYQWFPDYWIELSFELNQQSFPLIE